jgi:hypothetical protein
MVSALSYLVTAQGTSPHSATGHVAAIAAAQAAAITFAWLIPMTAICALTLAAAVAARSANVGAAVGVTAWACTLLVSRAASGAFSAAVTNATTYLPYLAVTACAAVVIGYATRAQRGAL